MTDHVTPSRGELFTGLQWAEMRTRTQAVDLKLCVSLFTRHKEVLWDINVGRVLLQHSLHIMIANLNIQFIYDFFRWN